jgi:hypothetical protein
MLLELPALKLFLLEILIKLLRSWSWQAWKLSNQFPSSSYHFLTTLEDILIIQFLVLASDLNGQISEIYIMF